MIFSISKNQVDYDPEDGREPKVWTREEFPFTSLLVGLRSLSYEPERGLIHIVEEADLNKVLVISAVGEDPRVQAIFDKLADIEAAAYPVPTTQETLENTRIIKVQELRNRRNTTIAERMGVDSGNMSMLVIVYQNTNPADHTPAMVDAYAIWMYASGKINQAATATQAQLDAYDTATDPSWPV